MDEKAIINNRATAFYSSFICEEEEKSLEGTDVQKTEQCAAAKQEQLVK